MMEGYSYPYAPPFPPIPDGSYPDHGDGFGDYYEMGPAHESKSSKRKSRSKHLSKRDTRRPRSRSKTSLSDRSQSQSKSRSRTISRSRSRSRSRSHSRPRSRELNMKTPSFLDDFRVMYLTPSKHKKSTTKYLATKKRQDKVQEMLKSDGLGSKRWLFYPRSSARDRQGQVTVANEVPAPRDNCDQRVKVDGHFLRKYKKSKRVDRDAPIAKLKRWELIFYKKLGFIHAV
ncbi:zinc finger Ran-binding domain-containing protein 2-like [Zerene cesonia]|uniref:zinc finger Ran-binding domain-containing protein 2-like n=1 Tax=Zerene cesonia TaxID=33412 RepID=UPI0018E53C85|nr:zinc finger Ran-binding domain-containing protein 2-like [Zerene cesonia]